MNYTVFSFAVHEHCEVALDMVKVTKAVSILVYTWHVWRSKGVV